MGGILSPKPPSGMGPPGASLGDILNAIINLTRTVTSLAQTYLQVQGLTNSAGITTATLVKNAPGRVCVVSVIVGGSAAGTIYDSTNVSSPTNPIYYITHYPGTQTVNFPTQYGIVVVPGSGQTVSVSYS
jgi:hypothetical protein